MTVAHNGKTEIAALDVQLHLSDIEGSAFEKQI